eukprot:UN05612
MGFKTTTESCSVKQEVVKARDAAIQNYINAKLAYENYQIERKRRREMELELWEHRREYEEKYTNTLMSDSDDDDEMMMHRNNNIKVHTSITGSNYTSICKSINNLIHLVLQF